MVQRICRTADPSNIENRCCGMRQERAIASRGPLGTGEGMRRPRISILPGCCHSCPRLNTTASHAVIADDPSSALRIPSAVHDRNQRQRTWRGAPSPGIENGPRVDIAAPHRPIEGNGDGRSNNRQPGREPTKPEERQRTEPTTPWKIRFFPRSILHRCRSIRSTRQRRAETFIVCPCRR